YWLYKYCGVGYPIVREDAKFSVYLCLRAWERGNRKKTNDQANNLFILGRYHIDHQTIETITWRPWLESAVSELDDVRRALLLSRTRMPLQVPNGNCEYYLGDRCWRQLTGTAGIPLDPPLSMSPHLSPADLQAMRQTDFVDCEQFVIGEERETYALYWANQTAERDGPDSGWHMEWTGRHELLSIHRLRDPPEMSVSCGAKELWKLTHGMRRLCLTEYAWDAQRMQELTNEVATPRRHLDSVDDQLYAHDLHLRMGRDVQVVSLSPRGSAMTMQRGSGPLTRGGGTSRRKRGTEDDFDPSQ
ncbi:hypothetical protein GIB67_026868, partial [Kingdonia uniflora]